MKDMSTHSMLVWLIPSFAVHWNVLKNTVTWFLPQTFWLSWCEVWSGHCDFKSFQSLILDDEFGLEWFFQVTLVLRAETGWNKWKSPDSLLRIRNPPGHKGIYDRGTVWADETRVEEADWWQWGNQGPATVGSGCVTWIFGERWWRRMVFLEPRCKDGSL